MGGTRCWTVAGMFGLVGLLAGGCASADRYVYESTPRRASTVRLVDTLENETLWSKDVPPEHHLVVHLGRTGEPSGMRVTGHPATSLEWTLYESPHTSINDGMWRDHVDDGIVDLDGRPVRLSVDYHRVSDPAPSEAPTEADDTDDARDSDDGLTRRDRPLD